MSRFNSAALLAAHAAVREAGRKVDEAIAQASREAAPFDTALKGLRRSMDEAFRNGNKTEGQRFKAVVDQTAALMEEKRNRILRPALGAYAAAATELTRVAGEALEAVSPAAPTPVLAEVAAAS
jgi:hypothetical protein